MHAIVILTAMTATSGLFGGHRQARMAHPAVASYAPSSCQTGRCPQTAGYTYPAPAPAYRTPTPAVSYTSYYYPTAPAATCATGTCPRR